MLSWETRRELWDESQTMQSGQKVAKELTCTQRWKLMSWLCWTSWWLANLVKTFQPITDHHRETCFLREGVYKNFSDNVCKEGRRKPFITKFFGNFFFVQEGKVSPSYRQNPASNILILSLCMKSIRLDKCTHTKVYTQAHFKDWRKQIGLSQKNESEKLR